MAKPSTRSTRSTPQSNAGTKRKARSGAKPQPKTFGLRALSAGVAAIGLGGALVALLWRTKRNPAEHAAPDLAADAPVPGTNRAPEAFRPDPTAVPTKAEYDSLRPATGPRPSMIQGKPGLNGATAHAPD